MVDRGKVAIIRRNSVKRIILENPFKPELRIQNYKPASGWGEREDQATQPDGDPVPTDQFESDVRIVVGSLIEDIDRSSGLPSADVSKRYLLTMYYEDLKDGLSFDYNGRTFETKKTKNHKMYGKVVFKYSELTDITRGAIDG